MSRIKIVVLAAVALVVSASAYAGQLLLATATGKELRGVTHINVNRNIKSSVLLSDFELKFSNGDHKIAEMGFLPAANHVKVGLRDGDGDDPFSARVTYYKVGSNLSWPVKTAAKKNCRGTCTLSIPKPTSVPDSWRFALLGFWFKRHGGDANVKRLAVRPRLSEGQIDVVYQDNGTFSYDVEVRYVQFHEKFTRGVGTRTGTGGKGVVWTKIPTKLHKGVVIIEGFDVRFTGSDHFLQHFAMKSTNQEVWVAFGDKNYDDAYTATVDFSVVGSELF